MLYHDDKLLSISFLALEFSITKATVSDAVKTLVKKKYIYKKQDIVDKRKQILKLTSKGIEIAKKISNFTQPINAIVHKDYGELTPIQISVYDDKLMIWNCGELPAGWSIETFKQKHSSKPYNPAIANVFFLADYIESWGRGIEKIIDESKIFNGVIPQFRWQNGLWIEFKFKKLDESSPKKTEDKIVDLIKEDSKITTKIMADKLSISKRAVLKQIQKLKEASLLKRVASARSGYWEVLDE